MKKFALIFACMSILSACSKSYEENWEDLRVDYLALNFPSNISKSSIVVYYSGTWTAELTDNTGWITIDRTSGAGVSTIEFQFSENLGLSRAATLTIYGGQETKTIPIVQKAGIANPRIEFSQRTCSFPAGSYEILLPFDSNIPSEFFNSAKIACRNEGTDVNWLSEITLTKTVETVPDDKKDQFPNGNRRYISALVSSNTDGALRNADLFITLEDAAKVVYKDSISLSQTDEAAYINIQGKDVANRDGGERSVTLSSNLGSILSDAEIIVSYPDADNSNFVSDVRIESNTLKYILSENNTGETRNATIALEYTDKAGVTTTTNPCLNIEQNLFSGSFADIEFTTANELLVWNGSYSDWKASDNIKLGADIDLQGQVWIGRDFAGTFDGQGHKIYNYRINGDTNAGFFTSLSGDASVSNLILGSSDGLAYDGTSVITTQSSTGAVYVGGLAGKISDNATVSNVDNFAKINLEHNTTVGKLYVGGLTGEYSSSAAVTRFRNHGTISNAAEADEMYIGGVLGNTSVAAVLNNCENYGNINNSGTCNAAYSSNTASGASMTSGVIGLCSAAAQLNGCVNEGRIENTSNSVYITVAGFIGLNKSAAATMTGCYNKGYVGSTPVSNNANQLIRIAGFVAHSTVNGTKLDNCSNTGTIMLENSHTILRNWTGGAFGYCRAVVISGCTFNAEVARGTVSGGKIGALIGQDETAGGVVEKNRIAGKVDDTVLTADNFLSYIVGLKNGSYTTSLAESNNSFLTE